MTAPFATDRYTDAQGRTWERYRDPLAPEPANPYRHVDGRLVLTIDAQCDSDRSTATKDAP